VRVINHVWPEGGQRDELLKVFEDFKQSKKDSTDMDDVAHEQIFNGRSKLDF
jgi:hypothetical protein